MTVLQSLFRSSEKIANLLPSLLSHSAILLKSLYEGLHSTRFAGKGENFWQYKEYTQGESVTNIDWRKSASSKPYPQSQAVPKNKMLTFQKRRRVVHFGQKGYPQSHVFFVCYPESQRCCYWSSNSRS